MEEGDGREEGEGEKEGESAPKGERKRESTSYLITRDLATHACSGGIRAGNPDGKATHASGLHPCLC